MALLYRRPPTRNDRPGRMRTLTRPRLFTVTRPARSDTDAPLLDTLTCAVLLSRTRLRRMEPMAYLPAASWALISCESR